METILTRTSSSVGDDEISPQFITALHSLAYDDEPFSIVQTIRNVVSLSIISYTKPTFIL